MINDDKVDITLGNECVKTSPFCMYIYIYSYLFEFYAFFPSNFSLIRFFYDTKSRKYAPRTTFIIKCVICWRGAEIHINFDPHRCKRYKLTLLKNNNNNNNDLNINACRRMSSHICFFFFRIYDYGRVAHLNRYRQR